MTTLKTVSAEARFRARNQITIPDAVVQAAGIELGETFVVEVEPEDIDTLRLRRIRPSYAGALRGLWGGDTNAYLEAERNAWE
jgi:bifunctional DNA-binding transcriptional regulator/antitoxin component of YhaV-PrlF toxin-antitoxin module